MRPRASHYSGCVSIQELQDVQSVRACCLPAGRAGAQPRHGARLRGRTLVGSSGLAPRRRRDRLQTPGLCRRHDGRWFGRPARQLRRRQEVQQCGTGRTSLLLRTTPSSARAPSRRTPPPMHDCRGRWRANIRAISGFTGAARHVRCVRRKRRSTNTTAARTGLGRGRSPRRRDRRAAGAAAAHRHSSRVEQRDATCSGRHLLAR